MNEKETKVKSKTGRPLFRDGIHFCIRRYTWRQEIKNLINYAIMREKRL